MKKLIFGLAIWSMMSAGALAFNGWGLYVGYWDTSELGDGLAPGFKVSIEMVPNLQLELRTAYFGDFDRHQQDLTIVPLEANLAYLFPVTENIIGHVGLGAGYYFMSGGWTWPDAQTKASADDDFGIYGVLGGEYMIQPDIGFFVEAKYITLSADKARTVGSEIRDLELDGLGVNVGFMVRW